MPVRKKIKSAYGRSCRVLIDMKLLNYTNDGKEEEEEEGDEGPDDDDEEENGLYCVVFWVYVELT